MTQRLGRRLYELRGKLSALPDVNEPPPTTLEILGHHTKERAWQQYLVHFLSADRAHGLGHAAVEHFLRALSDRDDITYSYSPFDLEDLRIEQEVTTEDGIPDVLLWSPENWFLCMELKLHASEGQDQTPRYVAIESFSGVGLEKSEVPTAGHQYVYIAPESASNPEADAFVHVSWEWVASVLQGFLANSYGEYPARTTAQLNDFVDTIQSELTMTEYEENQQERAGLYIDYHDEIAAVEAAFEEEWQSFTKSWGTTLGTSLAAAELVEGAESSAEYATVELTPEWAETARQWTFRQGASDWSWLFPIDWWTKLDEGRPIVDAQKPNARVGFIHRLERHRDDAVEDRTLKLYLRNAPSGHDTFYDNFAARFDSSDRIEPAVRETNFTRTGNKSNVLRAEYDINVDAHGDFFSAYIEALARGFDEAVVSNEELVLAIDELYEQTIDEDVSL